ncbi:RHS repeat-associated core domain-containing protein [Paraburkholderia sediminicola]|uniref:RHS repeat-associated core domain-containing protein n=1 Tax=Paraburkholderia sediminicola TaxID=458836 RepID=UPI0038B7E07F
MGTNATLGYDPEGRLVRTTINGAETNLLYDGQNLAGEYDNTGRMTRRYVFGPGVDAPLAQYEGMGTGTKKWLYANQQGSIVAVTNAVGATLGMPAYGPFGETEGKPESRFGYTGQQYLAPLGLYYYKARMYSPALGRFLQTDPVGTADDLNLYAYVKNNPINFTDPFGLAAQCSQSDTFGQGVARSDAITPVYPEVAVSGAIRVAQTIYTAVNAAGVAAKSPATSAENAANGSRLGQQLASEAQMGEAGITVAGSGTNSAFRAAQKVADEFGGSAADWVKKSSSSYTSKNGVQFETHWVENIKTGQRVEFKTKLGGN